VRISKKQKDGAKILLKEVTDAQRFGVAELRGIMWWASKKNLSAEIQLRVVGIYLYDCTVFQKIRR